MTKTDSKTNLKNSNTETAGKIQQAGNQNSENFNHGITEPVENTNTTTTTGFTNSGHEGNRKDSENFNKWITEPVENTKTTTTTGFTNSEQEGNRKDSGKFNYGITETLENTKTTTTTGFTNSGQEGNRKENINELTPSINAVDLYLDKGSMVRTMFIFNGTGPKSTTNSTEFITFWQEKACRAHIVKLPR